MIEAAKTLVPFLLFMLIPLWIPVSGVVAGRILDLFRPRVDPAVAALRDRVAATRLERARLVPAQA